MICINIAIFNQVIVGGEHKIREADVNLGHGVGTLLPVLDLQRAEEFY